MAYLPSTCTEVLQNYGQLEKVYLQIEKAVLVKGEIPRL